MSAEEDAWELDFSLARDALDNLKRLGGGPVPRNRVADLESQLASLKQKLVTMDSSAMASAKWKKLSALTKKLQDLSAGDTPKANSNDSTEYLLQEQNYIMQQQDEQLEDVSRSIYQLTGVAGEIGEVARTQVRLLDEVDLEQDDVHARVRADTRTVKKVSESQNTRSLHACICLLVLFFVLLLIL